MIDAVHAARVSTPALAEVSRDAQLDLELSGGPAGPLSHVPGPDLPPTVTPSPDFPPGDVTAPGLDEGPGQHRLSMPQGVTGVANDTGNGSFVHAVGQVDREYQSLQAELHTRLKAGALSNEELLLFQMRFQLAVQQVEMMSKTVEQSVTGLKTIIQTRD
jgi:hypothetical protein